MEIRNSFCVNYYKALTIRFVRELQSVLRFLHNQAILALISSFLFLYIIMYLDYLLIIFVKLLLMLVE